ncbi:MAG: autotransporter outer membrane beta-barrel domain-containing protein, partial [Rhodospirillales bacterium]|nr:autotransporter outer membrane beta-barrel domain-containing protein [Rhodospirillales bacterium]
MDASGTLSAAGADASALVIQSGVQTTTGQLDPTRTGGNVTVTWNGSLTGGTGTGAAIVLDGGANNTLTLSGGTVSAASGQAIRASFGNDSVFNSGILTGNVDLGSGANEVNTLVNNPGGTFNTGTRITLGPNGVFMNFGTLEIAGPRSIGTTTVNGNVQHLMGGPWNVDVDYAQGVGDQLVATGSLTVDGLVAPRLLNLPASFVPGQLSVQIASSPYLYMQGARVQNSVALTYGLAATSGPTQTANLAIVSANFAPPALLNLPSTNDAMKDVAGYYQSIWKTGSLGEQQAQFVKLGGILDLPTYQAALQDAAGTEYALPALAQVQAGSAFQTTLHSCPTFVEETTLLTEQSCAYLRNTDSVSHLADSEEGVGYRRTSAGIQIGGQGMVAPNWWIGAAIAPSQSWLTSNDGSSSGTGQTVDVGVVVKHQVAERWLFALSASYGHTDYDFSQTVQGPNGAE